MMQNLVLTLGVDDPGRALGAVATGGVPNPAGGYLLRKGQHLGPADVDALAALGRTAPGTQVSLLLLDPEDLDEGEAAALLGPALAGPGVVVQPPSQGRTRLAAAHNGLLRLDRAKLAAANRVPDVAIYTLFDGTPVAAGTLLAEAKITPLAAPRALVQQALAILAGRAANLDADVPSAVLEVLPFQPREAALLVRERLAPAAVERMVAVLQKKLAWLGSRLDPARVVETGGDRAEVARQMTALLAGGADLLLTGGGSASNPADPILSALPDIGATLLRRGLPVHPGSLLWIARRDETWILGVPSCGAFSEATALDLLLPRLLAQGAAALTDLDQLAEGGLLTRGMEHRFPPYG
ncbi:MAG TPA: hypothetical protein VM536_04270 [Chloroflexia bacterium]|nr:hypothetical protein [Chloroflexia bacterium]